MKKAKTKPKVRQVTIRLLEISIDDLRRETMTRIEALERVVKSLRCSNDDDDDIPQRRRSRYDDDE